MKMTDQLIEIEDYIIVCEYYDRDLREKILEFIKKGYYIYGTTYMSGSSNNTYNQTMIKPKKIES